MAERLRKGASLKWRYAIKRDIDSCGQHVLAIYDPVSGNKAGTGYLYTIGNTSQGAPEMYVGDACGSPLDPLRFRGHRAGRVWVV